jgi:hypothetical protein
MDADVPREENAGPGSIRARLAAFVGIEEVLNSSYFILFSKKKLHSSRELVSAQQKGASRPSQSPRAA